MASRFTILIIGSLAATPALAQSSNWYDHSGSLGLLVSTGGEYRLAVRPPSPTENAGAGTADIGGTLSLSRTWSAVLEGRLSVGAPQLGVAVIGGVRNFRGERLKTFVDLMLIAHVLPLFTIGPRLGFGVQWELSSIVGIYGLAAVQFGGGMGLRFGAETMVGLQFRSYLFE